MMETRCKTVIPALFRLWVTGLLCLGGCTHGASSWGNHLDTAEHHVQSGIKLLDLEKYDDAMREFTLARELDKDVPGAYLGAGLVFGHRGDCSSGIQNMEKAFQLARNRQEQVDAYVGMIRVYTLGNASAPSDWLERAERAYAAAIETMPESSAACYYMGEAYTTGQAFEKASRMFRRVLDLNNAYVVEARRALNRIQKTEKK
jgi:tetratricopeptide (TPR) repeat protein